MWTFFVVDGYISDTDTAVWVDAQDMHPGPSLGLGKPQARDFRQVQSTGCGNQAPSEDLSESRRLRVKWEDPPG